MDYKTQLLKGKAAIITGSSRGIGKAIALAFADNGADIIIHGTNEELLQNLKTQVLERGSKCEYVVGSIDKYDTAKKLVETCMNKFNKIDILVNNAGINSRISFTDLSLEDWDKMLQINLTSCFYTCKCVIPIMIEQNGGCIINMSSSAGKKVHPNASISYGVSKAGINSLTQKLSYDFAPNSIRVNAISPGPIETDMSKQWTPEYREEVLNKIPLRRLGSGEDVANTAVFLASDMAGFITGEIINVNGGKL